MRAIAVLTLMSSLAWPALSSNFSYGTRTVQAPEIGVVTNWVIRTGGVSYAFMPPSQWRFEPQPGEPRLVWVSPDYARISITLQTELLQELDPGNAAKLERYVQERLPEGTVRDRVRFHTESETGTAFDIAWNGPQHTPMRARLGVIQLAGSNFEFLLSAEAERFSKVLVAFNGLLTSFQVVKPPN